MYKRCTTEKAALQQRKIEECLLSVMQDKPYSEITVSSLCEQTELSRKTFYRLFESKQDVLYSLIDRIIRDYIRFRLPQNQTASSVPQDLLSFFCYWLEQRPLLDALSKNGISTTLYERCVRHVMEEDVDILLQLGAKQGQMSNRETITFYLSGLLTLVVAWHHSNYDKAPEEMATLTHRLLSTPLI